MWPHRLRCEEQPQHRGERAEFIETTTRLENTITELERQLRSAHAALLKGGLEASNTQQQLEDELQRARGGRVWASVREEESKRRRVEVRS